ncbi:MAG: hypothetical protein ACREQ5_03620 [Candidatus Dormibacteria bacterium]
MSSELQGLKEQFAALLLEVKQLRAEAAVQNQGSNDWGKQNTARGHPDRRLFPDHPGVNAEQVTLTGRELEDMVLRHEKRLNAADKGGVTDASVKPAAVTQKEPTSGAGSK